MTGLRFVCPQTGALLKQVSDDVLYNTQNDTEYHRVDGIWRMLPAGRMAHYQKFITDYEMIRQAEGRGTADTHWYTSLPFPPPNTPFATDWRIRARSYEVLQQVLNTVPNQHILDLGAGNCWLSNQLTEAGHHVVAIDLLTNAFDGLGAHEHYANTFTCIQAEYDRLPLEQAQFDVVIYNGAFHYANDYICTLNEARRVLKPNGKIIIMDSPVYHDGHSGQQMVKEREDHFETTYGTRSDALDAEHYLTYTRLKQISDDIGLDWQIHTPNYGWRWHLRPLKARLRGHREPAKFHVIVGTFA